MLALVAGWESVATIGLASTVIVILAWRSPQLVDSTGKILKIILKYQLAKNKIPAKAKTKQANLKTKIESKRNKKPEVPERKVSK